MPESDDTSLVPLSLIRCLAALVVIGVFLPGALIGLANAAVAIIRLPYASRMPSVNGWPDVLRLAIIQGADWRGVADWTVRYGLRIALVAAGVMLLRGARAPRVAGTEECMKDYRWFKIMVRAFGLLLVGMSVPYVMSAVEFTLSALGQGTVGVPSMYWPRAIAYGAVALGELLLGLYMLAGAPKFVRYCIESADKRCIRCDYDLTGLAGTCPECGLPIPPRPPGSAA